MFVLRHKQRDEHVDVEKADHAGSYASSPFASRSTSLNGEDRGARSRAKYRNAVVKADIGLSHAPKQGLDEVIDPLSRLACQLRQGGP